MMLWPDADEALGRTRLRRLAHQVNTTAGVEIVTGDADTLNISDALDFSCDVVAVRSAAHAVLRASELDLPEQQAALLPQAEAAQFLHGFSLESDLFFDWVARHRAEHERLVSRALLRLAELQLLRGKPEAALEAAEQVLKLDACAEKAHAAVIGAWARLGNMAAVETAYFNCAEVLRRELGVRPSARIEAAYAAAVAHGDAQARLEAQPQTRVQIQFAQTSDGAVAFAAQGSGPETLVIIPGLLSHVEVALDEPRIRQVLDRLAVNHRIVLMDRRGTGLSERIGVAPTAEAAIEDVLAVLDAIGAPRAWILGSSVGGTIGIEMTATHPERVAGLLLFGANARGAWAEDYPWAMDDAALQKWIDILHSGWGGIPTLNMFAPSAAAEPDVQSWWARMLRQAASQNSVASLVKAFHSMDVRARLPHIAVPTLVVQREGDRIVRKGAGEYLAAHIPGAELAMLAGDDHFLWHGDSDAVVNAVNSFVARHAKR